MSSPTLEPLDIEPYLSRKPCRDCDFCDGLADMGEKPRQDAPPPINDLVEDGAVAFGELFRSLSFLDRYLSIFILLAMISGVLIGYYKAEQVHRAFNGAEWQGVSIPILVGLVIMMWPVLTKVQYEQLPTIFRSTQIWYHIALSFVLNWIIAPFVMLGVAWATLPEESLERERKGVILVGIARCIAMVLVWTAVAQGSPEYCAIFVGINSILQIVLFSPYALLFLNYLGGRGSQSIELDYSHTAISVCIYLGIPLAAGMITRLVSKRYLSPSSFKQFIKYFSPLTLLGLLYTIVVLFANQGQRIVHDVGSVFRIFVPLILYFIIVWSGTFFGLNWLSRRGKSGADSRWNRRIGGYDKAVVQAFTAASNNFELAIAVAIASFGTESPEALAATVGPLVEVPVLLGLSYLALFLRSRLRWEGKQGIALA